MSDSDVVFRFEVTDSESDEVVIKQPMLGFSPYLLILPELSEDGDQVIMNVSACDISLKEMAAMFEEMAEMIRENLDSTSKDQTR